MKKKGLVFGITMVLVTLTVLTFAYIAVKDHLSELPDYVVGEQQFSLVEDYQAAEDRLFKIDSAVRIASKLAVYELGRMGGFSENNLVSDPDKFYGKRGCGDYKGYPLWNTKESGFDECFPDYRYEYQEVFNLFLGRSLTEDVEQFSYSIALEPRTDYTTIRGSTEDRLIISKGVRADPKIHISRDALKDANEVTDFESCDALTLFRGQSENGAVCYHTEKDVFDNEFVSIDSPYIRFIKNSEGNAFMPSFAADVVAAGELWASREGGSASLAAYSGSTGDHSCRSRHNIGKAIDITGCYDRDGVYHDSKQHDEVFNRCEELLKGYWEGKGMFISYRDCRIVSGNGVIPCPSRDSLMESHYNHIHLDER